MCPLGTACKSLGPQAPSLHIHNTAIYQQHWLEMLRQGTPSIRNAKLPNCCPNSQTTAAIPRLVTGLAGPVLRGATSESTRRTLVIMFHL